MAVDVPVGQRVVEATLARALTGKQVAHAYLFAGPEGLGKRAYARSLAQSLNCRGTGERTPFPSCGICKPCRQIGAGTYPDLSWISPDGASIKIGQMRELQRATSFSPNSGSYRVVVLDEAHLMTLEAANSILKLLEDAPPATVMILVTSQPEMLLGTILSRCQRLSFRPVPHLDLVEFLTGDAGLSSDEAQSLARLSRGNPGRALELKSSDEYRERRDFMSAVFHSLGSAGDRAMAAWAQTLADANEDRAYLGILECLIRDVMLLGVSPESDLIINRDLRAELGQVLEGTSLPRLLRSLEHVQVARDYLGNNVNRLLTWELVLLKIHQELGR